MTIQNIIDSVNQLDDDNANVLLTNALHQLTDGQQLSFETMQKIMALIMSGRCSEILLSAIITALKIKGESIDDIGAFASIMRAFANPVSTPHSVVDIVGTGGDGANLFNVSTASAFVMAVAGAKVAKHGSTGVSSRSGASDLLATAGVNLAMNGKQIAQSIDKTGVGFMFAPNHHPAMRHAKAVRGALKMRTIFNLLGPLTNPANARHALLGAYSIKACEQMCQTMQTLGGQHILVVHSDDGLDEISLAKPTQVFELKDNVIKNYQISPTDFGIAMTSLDDLTVSDSEESLTIIANALQGKDDNISKKARNIIALNAGAGLYAGDIAPSLADGVAMAQEILMGDLAYQKMQEFVKFSQAA